MSGARSALQRPKKTCITDIAARSSKSVYRFQFGCVCGLIFCVSTMRNVKDRDEYLRQERLFFLALALPSICLLTVCMAVQDMATKINIVRFLFLLEFILKLILHSNPTRLCHNFSISIAPSFAAGIHLPRVQLGISHVAPVNHICRDQRKRFDVNQWAAQHHAARMRHILGALLPRNPRLFFVRLMHP